MKVKGNAYPQGIHIEPYQLLEGYVEVRLTENVEQLEDNLYQYDEYIVRAKDKEGLAEEIEANLNDWLITGRTLEVNDGASVVQDMKAALKVLGVDVNE